MSLNVRYEYLDRGPIVRHRSPNAVAVVDYAGTNKVWYRPVDLEDAAYGFRNFENYRQRVQVLCA